MRREDFFSAYEHLNQLFEETDVQSALRYLAASEEGERTKVISPLLRTYTALITEFQKVGEAEKELLNRAGLELLVNEEFWTEVLSGRDVREISKNALESLKYFAERLRHVLGLLRREMDRDEIVITESSDKKSRPSEIITRKITFLIRETEIPSLTLKQFRTIVDEIETLYLAVTKIEGIDIHDLIVGNLDSGSDKSIDLFGVARAIDKVSATLLQVWDRIRYAKANQVSTSVKTAAESIDLLNKLNDSAKKGAITPEEAEKLRRNVLTSVDSLFKNGVFTAEMLARSSITPDQIPLERRRLLTHASRADTERKEVVRLRDADGERDAGDGFPSS